MAQVLMNLDDEAEEDDAPDDDDDRCLTEDDFGDDEDPGRSARYYRWLNDDGSIPLSERCGF